MISLEINAHHAAVAQKNIEKAGVSEQVEIRVGKALDILAEMVAGEEGPFDFIFIDADKPPYADYFQYALQLSRKGSLIICDNVIRDGKVLDENTTDESARGAHRFNKLLSQTKHVTATILQTVGAKEHDGIAIVLVDE